MRQRIAIIGSGISGLTAAYLLQLVHDITLFEANDYLGGHTNTIDVMVDGTRHAIDTGFVVFNERTYPNFFQLLSDLGVSSKPTSMSFSVHDERTGLEYNGHSLKSLFAQRRNLFRPAFYRMLADILRFNRQAQKIAVAGGSDLTVDEFVKRSRYSRQFVEQYLMPMGSAIWSCPVAKFSEFPIQFIAEFYQNHGLLQLCNRPVWRVIENGSQTYVRQLIRGFTDRIRLRTPIAAVWRFSDRVQVQAASGEVERFDRVIFACHSDQALRILGRDATATERQVLGEFPYEPNVAVLHTDSSLLPRSRRAWACWNYRVKQTGDSAATLTYNLNMLQGIQARHTFCVTLNDESRIDPARILKRFEYHHPRFTMCRGAAQQRHSELLTANRTSFCGAYWGNGFHEDGVVSARAVANAICKETDQVERVTTIPTASANGL